jgi:arylsulfatase A-like enzyme
MDDDDRDDRPGNFLRLERGRRQPHPNIVYIISDDRGWKDVGHHGSDIKTTNIDTVAQGGAWLEQFYAQPMCTLTVAALVMRRYPFRYGLQIAIPSANPDGLPTEEWLLAPGAEGGGYETVLTGKWHMGHADRKYWPRQRGFDHHYGPLLGEIDYCTHEEHGVRRSPGPSPRVSPPCPACAGRESPFGAQRAGSERPKTGRGRSSWICRHL